MTISKVSTHSLSRAQQNAVINASIVPMHSIPSKVCSTPLQLVLLELLVETTTCMAEAGQSHLVNFPNLIAVA